MKGKRAKINSIMLQFDFRKVKDTMLQCSLVWRNSQGDEYIPSVEEIRLKAEQLLKDATNTSTSYCKISSGGFICRKTSASLELMYVIEAKFA